MILKSPMEFLALIHGYIEKIEMSLKRYDGITEHSVATIVFKVSGEMRHFVATHLSEHYGEEFDVKIMFESDFSSGEPDVYSLFWTFEVATPFSNFREIRVKFLTTLTNYHPASQRSRFEITTDLTPEQRGEILKQSWDEEVTRIFKEREKELQPQTATELMEEMCRKEHERRRKRLRRDSI